MREIGLESTCLCVFVAGVRWVGGDNLGDRFLMSVKEDEIVDDILGQITSVVDGEWTSLSHSTKYG